MEEGRRAGTDVDVKEEIVRLCEDYSIASEYASFIVLENDAEYQRWKIERRNANRVRRDRVAREAVRQQLEQLRRQASEALGPRAVSDKQQLATTSADATQSNQPLTTDQQPRQSSPPQRGGDINIPATGGRSGGGGGAIDPVSAAIAPFRFAHAPALCDRLVNHSRQACEVAV